MQVDNNKSTKIEKTPRRKKQHDQLSGGMELFASPKRTKTDEVTGVSRSGRVRKKSSKLVDFESPNDLADNKLKKQQKAAQHLHAQQVLERFEAQQNRKSISPIQNNIIIQRNRKNSDTTKQHVLLQKNTKLDTASSQSETDVHSDNASDSDDATDINDMIINEGQVNNDIDDDDDDDDDRFSIESGSDIDDIDPLLIDDKETGFKRLEPPSQELPSSQANSLYMLEKSKKKIIIKDGKIIGRMKAQRKDKGKTRFTAYMLWSKEVRQELIEQHPEMDFAAISKRLGELWSTVPNIQKYNWQRRAKRLASSSSTGSKESPIKSSPIRKKFLNKNGNTKEITKLTTKKTIQLGGTSIVGNISQNKSLIKDDSPAIGGGSNYKVSGTKPMDVAAHLKLLGESLTIIGERLKEHEGQIAVSGSLSVLLDSFLCALGPLMCLTQQIPEANGAQSETLSGILDNIAYIMPGL
ncbi:putative uncharacterized protein DDB_G0270496 isoform X2 [Aphidius gifuensis]|uniref:putative uncharacterized protein DDB_G0270496 isoform X2 n=1 Tax=Aphidius gifuensis TaxID=684658 RepID=UPI001CDD7348|nr:putative uncharacterized protein DDB_G0270496 isoform X2 [Aphidius gifuensis]